MTSNRWHIATSLLIFGFCGSQFAYSSKQCNGPRTPDEIAKVLWENSNYTSTKRTRPNISRLLKEDPMANPSDAEPDIIKLQMSVVSVNDINQKRGEVEMKVSFSQRWNDYRLKYASSEGCFSDDDREGFSLEEISNVWAPDVVIGNAASQPLQIAGSFWVYPNGDVQYSQSLLLKLSCNLNFKKLPKDTQLCRVIVSTWKDNALSILFDFWDPPITRSNTSGTGIGSLEWSIQELDAKVITRYGALSKKPNSVAIFSVRIARGWSYYTNFVIFPVILIVILAYTSFFIDQDALPARATMSIISFLTISNFLSSELKSLPHLGAGEAWLLRFMQVSMVFPFYCVVVNVLCHYLFRLQKRTEELRKVALDMKQNDSKSCDDNDEQENTRTNSQYDDSTITTSNIDISGLDDHKVDCLVRKESFSDIEDKNISIGPVEIDPGSPKQDSSGDIEEQSSEPNTSLKTMHITGKTIKQYMLANGGIKKFDRVVLKKDGTLFVNDKHIEIFSPVAYPIAYIVLCLVHWQELD